MTDQMCPTGQAVFTAAGLAAAGIVAIGLAVVVLVDRAIKGERLLDAAGRR